MSYLDVLKYTSPASFLIAKAVEKGVEAFANDEENSTIQALQEEEIRQNIQSRVLQEKARVEQELAIARRIESADEVEIEEYYDNSGKGNLGLKGDEAGIALGVSGEGRRVSKRIYKFKGCTSIERIFELSSSSKT